MLGLMRFLSVKKIVFGLNAIQEIGSEAKALGSNALLITDRNMVKLGVIERISRILMDSNLNVEVFDGCEAEPRLEVYEEAKNAVRDLKPDLVIGVGGGSNMDVAKVTSALATNDGDAVEYLVGGRRTFEKPRLPLIQVTTTAGTGSEVTPFAVVTVGGEKWDFNANQNLLCDVAIVDPMLTLTMPPSLTASTAVDALGHAIESILSKRANFMTMPYALRAARWIFKFARRAYSNGGDIEARYYMSLAAMYAGFSLCNAGIVLGHGVAYTFSAQYKIPHGVAVGIALPYIMKYNMPLTQDKLSIIGRALQINAEGKTPREAAMLVIREVKGLLDDLDMPTSLKEINVPRAELDAMVNRLLTKYTYLTGNNPRRIVKEEIRGMYEQMWEGNLASSNG